MSLSFVMRNADIWLDARDFSAGEPIPLNKHPLSAEPGTLLKELNLILNGCVCFGKLSIKLNAVQVCCWWWIFQQSLSWHAVKLVALGLHHLCVAAALCSYHSREAMEQLWRPSRCTVLLPAWPGRGWSCPAADVSGQECPSGHISILLVSSARLCLVLSPGPTPGWVDREQPGKRDKWLVWLLQTARAVSQLYCRGGNGDVIVEIGEGGTKSHWGFHLTYAQAALLEKERVKWLWVRCMPCTYRQIIILKLKTLNKDLK